MAWLKIPVYFMPETNCTDHTHNIHTISKPHHLLQVDPWRLDDWNVWPRLVAFGRHLAGVWASGRLGHVWFTSGHVWARLALGTSGRLVWCVTSHSEVTHQSVYNMPLEHYGGCTWSFRDHPQHLCGPSRPGGAEEETEMHKK
eukprot:2655841-Prymnesium_polylepis.1